MNRIENETQQYLGIIASEAGDKLFNFTLSDATITIFVKELECFNHFLVLIRHQDFKLSCLCIKMLFASDFYGLVINVVKFDDKNLVRSFVKDRRPFADNNDGETEKEQLWA